MPRGQRKSLEEKIQAKQELINALNIRMESEQRELEELFEQKKRKELVQDLECIILYEKTRLERARNLIKQQKEDKRQLKLF